MKEERLLTLIEELRGKSAELPWLEFKQNNHDPALIGRLISALSNSARMADQPFGYALWGIEDKTHEIVGTLFDPACAEKGNQPLQMWLEQMLTPVPAYEFHRVGYEGHRWVVLLTVAACTGSPVFFQKKPFLRIGSATNEISGKPERLQQLYAKVAPYSWETEPAKNFVTSEEVLSLLDYPAFFNLIGRPLPDNKSGVLDGLQAERLIRPDVGDRWDILNLGAISLARSLSSVSPQLERKAVRVTIYEGRERTREVSKRYDGKRGYAAGFEALVDFLDARLPVNEHIGDALREEHPVFPPSALRELIANALIHQDFSQRGVGPLIEVFSDRIEISNPGIPLNPIDRLIDFPPRSRNEVLASLMRRFGLCEENGTGIDKIVNAAELFQLPPPSFKEAGDTMRAVLYGPRKYAEMTSDERIRACYQHASLRFLAGKKMTNSSLRKRLGVAKQNAAQVSDLFSEAKRLGLIKLADEDSPRGGYHPAWA